MVSTSGHAWSMSLRHAGLRCRILATQGDLQVGPPFPPSSSLLPAAALFGGAATFAPGAVMPESFVREHPRPEEVAIHVAVQRGGNLGTLSVAAGTAHG